MAAVDPHRFDHDRFRVAPGTEVDLARWPTDDPGGMDKDAAREAMAHDKALLREAQELLWASQSHSLLIVFQAMDAGGKDSTIKHVMSGVNPQGVDVHNFRAPNDEERLRHFLWRPSRVVPARGRIAIFNRSYYEEVLVVRVHPEHLDQQWLPPEQAAARERGDDEVWRLRYQDINEWEHLSTRNGISIVKFFLHLGYAEQRERFLDRLERPDKQWKFSASDFRERGHWDEYQRAFAAMLSATSTDHAPWYVIPADRKWFMQAVVADIITARIAELPLRYPEVSVAKQADLEAIRDELRREERAG